MLECTSETMSLKRMLTWLFESCWIHLSQPKSLVYRKHCRRYLRGPNYQSANTFLEHSFCNPWISKGSNSLVRHVFVLSYELKWITTYCRTSKNTWYSKRISTESFSTFFEDLWRTPCSLKSLQLVLLLTSLMLMSKWKNYKARYSINQFTRLIWGTILRSLLFYFSPAIYRASELLIKVGCVKMQALDYGISDLKAFFSSTEFSNASFELDEQRGIIRHRLTH